MVSAVANVASPLQIIRALTSVLRSVTDVDAVLTYEKDHTGNIAGKFRSGREIFDYLITPDDKVSFVASTVKTDSYLGGYYLPNIQPIANDTAYFTGYTYAKIARLDRKGKSKAKKCKVGQRCKNTCIAKGLTCDRQSLSPKQSRTLAGARASIPSKSKIGINSALIATALLATGAGVALAARRGGEPLPTVTPPPRVRDNRLAIAGGALGAVGVGVGAIAASRRTATTPPGVEPTDPSPPPPVDPPNSQTPPSTRRTASPPTPPQSFPPQPDPWDGDVPIPPPSPTTRKRESPRSPAALPNPQSDRPGLPPARRKGSAKSVEVIRPVTSRVPPEGLTPPLQGEAPRQRRRNQTVPINSPSPPKLPPSRGNSISDSLNFYNFDEESTRKLENTRDQISKVINAPGLSRMTVRAENLNSLGGSLAAYQPYWSTRKKPDGTTEYADQKIGDIAIDPNANKHGSVELSLIHEVAHAIDHQILDPSSNMFASNSSPELEGFRAVARTTKAYKKIERLSRKAALESSRKIAEYALDDREVFARAFEQYVVKKSGSKALTAHFKARQKEYSRNSPYWDDDDFKQIENELDKLFKQKGWR